MEPTDHGGIGAVESVSGGYTTTICPSYCILCPPSASSSIQSTLYASAQQVWLLSLLALLRQHEKNARKSMSCM